MRLRILFLCFCLTCGFVCAEDRVSTARQQRRAGDFAGALKTLTQAHKAAPPQSADQAAIEIALTEILFIRGEHMRAVELGKHALAIYLRLDGERSRRLADALHMIGANYTAGSDYGQGRAHLDRAIAMWRDAGGAEDATYARMLMSLAFTELRVGDYARAQLTIQCAIAIFETSADKDGAGQAFRVLAQILTELGDFSGARRAQGRALPLLEKDYGSDSDLVGDLLITMGNAARDAGDYAGAENMHRRAFEVYQKCLGPRNTRVGGALDSLGQDLQLLGRLDEARRVTEQAISIQKDALGPRSPWVGNLIQGLAKIAAAAGDYKRSKELYEQNLDIWREQLGATHPFTVVSLTQMADVLAHLGDPERALETALEAARIRRENLSLTVRTVEEQQALRYASVRMTSLDTAMTLALAGPPSAKIAAWDTVIHVRALVLDEMGARHRAVRRSSDPQVARTSADLAAARSDLARLVVQGKGKLTQADYDVQLEAGRSRIAHLEAALAVRSAAFRTEIAREHAGLKDVRTALPAGSAIVAFSRFQRKDYSKATDQTTPFYAAFVLRPGDGGPQMLALGPAAQIEAAVRTWRDEIERERASMGRAAAANEARYRQAGAALRRIVWDPLAPYLRGVRRVYIVPDGALQFVNFQALPTAETRYLVETGPLLHTLSAERDLVGKHAPAIAGKLLAVGDPAFRARESGGPALVAASQFRGRHSACAEFAKTSFEPLPGSEAEARALLRIWRGQGWTGGLLTGSTATEAAVKREAPGSRVLHLATHGFFLEDCGSAEVAAENPLLRSGLALAGANHRANASAGQEDGILTAEEAASLDLEGTEWVVLSGCDTGIGEIKAGEGVLGLRRAFQEAGARTVITSLWPVDDQEARDWMTSLYNARFVRKLPTAESMRSSNLYALTSLRSTKKSTHPFHWASFVAVGDWR